jgi:hypothetical protein
MFHKVEEASIAQPNAQTELRVSFEDHDITLDIDYEMEKRSRDQSSLVEYLRILYREPQFRIYLLGIQLRQFKNNGA